MKPVAKRIGIKDLAAHLGLAEGTVSRALNAYPDISEKTRQRVSKAANELGYKPNQTARMLARGVAEAVAFLMPSNSNSLSEPFIAQMLQGLGESMSKRGWDLVLKHSVSIEQETINLKKLINSGNVSGVVLSRPLKNDSRIKLLQEAKFPFIVHGRSIDCKDYAWYDVDSEKAFFDSVDHLVALGHQRIGFIGAPLYYNFAQMRLDGYRAGLEANSIPFDEGLVQITEMSDDSAERAAGELLDAANPASAILCISDTSALGALAAIRARNLVPGKDVSVIGYDGLSFGQHSNPPLTTMAQPQVHSGRQLGDMLLAIIDGGNPKDFQELRSAELLRRKTDGPYQGAF